MLNLAFAVTAVLCVIVAIFAPQLVRSEFGIAPGFTYEQQELVIHLMRINLVATLIFSMSGLIMSGLQAHQHFILTALAPPLYNLGQIAGALFLAPLDGYVLAGMELPAYGFGVEGLVYGVLIGAFFHLSIQVPALIYYQFRWHVGFDLGHEGVRRILRLMAPRLLTVFLIQLIFLSRDNLASRLEEGAITAMSYGWTIMQVPETLIGTAIGTAILPTLAEHSTQKNKEKFQEVINTASRIILALGMGAGVLGSIGLYPLVEPVFGFGPEGTILLVWTARAYLVGLLGHALLEVVTRAFYAQQDAGTPLWGTFLRVGVFIGLSIVLFRPFSVVGIALADSIAVTVEVVYMFFLLVRRQGLAFSIHRVLRRVLLGSAIAGGVLLVGMILLPLPPLFAALIGLIGAGCVYLFFIRPELEVLVRM